MYLFVHELANCVHFRILVCESVHKMAYLSYLSTFWYAKVNCITMIECTAKKWKYSHPGTNRLPHSLIAYTVGCPVGTVKAIRTGKRNSNTTIGRKIILSESMINESLLKIQKAVQK